MSIVLKLRKPWCTKSSRVLPGRLAAMSPVAPSGTSPGLYMSFCPQLLTTLFYLLFVILKLCPLYSCVAFLLWFPEGGVANAHAQLPSWTWNFIIFILFKCLFFSWRLQPICHFLFSEFPECFKIIRFGHLGNVLGRVALTKIPKHYNLIMMGV